MASDTKWMVVPKRLNNQKIVVRKDFKEPNKHNYTIINIPYNNGKNNIGIILSGVANHPQVKDYNLIPIEKDGIRTIVSKLDNGKFIKESEVVFPQAHLVSIIEEAFPVENEKNISYLTFNKNQFIKDGDDGYKVFLPEYMNEKYGNRYILTSNSHVFSSTNNNDNLCISIYKDQNYSLYDENGKDIIVNSNDLIKDNTSLYKKFKNNEKDINKEKSIQEHIKEYVNNKDSVKKEELSSEQIVLFDKTPNSLLANNEYLNENAQITISYENLGKILDKNNNKPQIVDHIKSVINNPMCILRGSKEDTYLFVSDEKIDGKNIVLPLKVEGKNDNTYTIDEVKSIYLKDDIEFFLGKEFYNNNIISINKKKIEELSIYNRLLLPNISAFSTYDDSITENMNSVNKASSYSRAETCKRFTLNNGETINLSNDEFNSFIEGLKLDDEAKKVIKNRFADTSFGDEFSISGMYSDGKMYDMQLSDYITKNRDLNIKSLNKETEPIVKINPNDNIDINKGLELHNKIYDFLYGKDGANTVYELAERELLKNENKIDKDLIVRFINERGGDPFSSDRELASYILVERVIKDNGNNYDVNSFDVSNEIDNILGIKKEKENPKKIDDFGKKIGGAKKDLWKERGLLNDDIKSMNIPEVIKLVNKKNVWIKPDYQKLVDSGLSRDIVYFYKNVIDSIPTTFEVSSHYTEDQVINEAKKYIGFVNKIKEKALSYKDIKDCDSFYNWLREEFVNGYRIKDEWTNININKLLKTASNYYCSFNSIRKKMNEQEFCMSENQKNDQRFNDRFTFMEIGEGKGRFSFLGNTINLYCNGSISSLSKENYEKIKDCKYVVFDRIEWEFKGGNNLDKLKAECKNIFNNKTKDKNIKGANKKKKFKYNEIKNLNRTGIDYRHGKDATGDDFIKDFNFYGGEFGNWENQDERQKNLNFAYDSFMDLSKVLGFDPKNIALNKNLSIAFGARGAGRALATYEPLRKVINLTKMKGAGSLAHEFGHFLDNYTYRNFIKNENDYAGYGSELSYKFKNENNPVSKEYDQLMDKIFHKKANKAECIEYIENNKEKIRNECFKYVLQYKNCDLYKRLEGLFDKLDNGSDIKDINILYKGICSDANKIYAGKYTEENKESYNMAYFIHRNEAVFSHKFNNYHTFHNGLVNYINNLYIDTDFYKGSKLFDGEYSKEGHGYWSSHCEMFARAFACYCNDKLKEMGIVNNYLTGHSDLCSATKNDGTIIKAYPDGEERKEINKCFDNLFTNLKEKVFNFDQEKTINNSNSIKEKNMKELDNYEEQKSNIINNLNSIKRTI